MINKFKPKNIYLKPNIEILKNICILFNSQNINMNHATTPNLVFDVLCCCEIEEFSLFFKTPKVR